MITDFFAIGDLTTLLNLKDLSVDLRFFIINLFKLQLNNRYHPFKQFRKFTSL